MNGKEALKYIEDRMEHYGLTRFTDPARTKSQVFVTRDGRQLVIWHEQTRDLFIKLEAYDQWIEGVTVNDKGRGSSLKTRGVTVPFGVGVRLKIASEDALKKVLDWYCGAPSSPISWEEMQANLEKQVEEARKDPEARRRRLEKSSGIPRRILTTRYEFVRDHDVIAEVLERAEGRCELCGKEAPFRKRRDGEPYLEVHHRLPLAQGGLDLPANAVAACPNCHRKAHSG